MFQFVRIFVFFLLGIFKPLTVIALTLSAENVSDVMHGKKVSNLECNACGLMNCLGFVKHKCY